MGHRVLSPGASGASTFREGRLKEWGEVLQRVATRVGSREKETPSRRKLIAFGTRHLWHIRVGHILP